ncbi:LytTR family DNA-binding domain-containing protein [Urechidicola sp. KH5]
MKLRTYIVEDEQTSRDILKSYLQKYCPNIEILGEASNIEDALIFIRNHELDVVFLDVEMPYGSGFDLLDKLPDVPFETIFVTAYDHYAIEALNNHASYYLLKPISIDDLIKAVDYVSSIKEKEQSLEASILKPALHIQVDKITIPTQEGFEVIETNQILYCKADDNYTHINLLNGKSKLVSKTLKHFETILGDSGFVRIHKSYLVNVKSIVSYKKGKGGTIALENGKELSVAPSRKAQLLSFFS